MSVGHISENTNFLFIYRKIQIWIEKAASHAWSLKVHLKTHSGDYASSNKCNQCDFASSESMYLRSHLKTHSGEKSNKCNLCDYTSSQAGNLMQHLKKHSGEQLNKCNQCDSSNKLKISLLILLLYFLPISQHILSALPRYVCTWGAIWKRTVGKSQINATIPLLRQAIWCNIWKSTVGNS